MKYSLIHGTSSKRANNIIVHGIIPNKHDNWCSHAISGMTYLTDQSIIAEFYAIKASILDNDTHISKVYVEIDEDRLFPDENIFLNDMGDNMIQIAKEKTLIYKRMWRKSLNEISLVCHNGIIDKDSIISVDKLPLSDSYFYGLVSNSDMDVLTTFEKSMNYLSYLHKTTGLVWDKNMTVEHRNGKCKIFIEKDDEKCYIH